MKKKLDPCHILLNTWIIRFESKTYIKVNIAQTLCNTDLKDVKENKSKYKQAKLPLTKKMSALKRP